MKLEPELRRSVASEEPFWLQLELEPGNSNEVRFESHRVPITFADEARTNAAEELSRKNGAGQASEFENLMRGMLERFVNLPAPEMEQELDGALAQICEFLELDWAGLWRNSPPGTNSFHLVYRAQVGSKSSGTGNGNGASHPRATMAAVPLGTESKSLFPWMSTQATDGRAVTFSAVDKLPSEAKIDKATLSRLGTRSVAVFPLLPRGKIRGVVSFERVEERCPWSEPLISRLKFVAEVFAQIMARQCSAEMLGVTETQLSLAAACADAATWILDLQTGRIKTAAESLNLLRLSPNLELTFERFLAMVHPEDRERLRRAQEQAIATGGELNIEFRIILGEQEVRWVSTRGRCQKGVTDLTEQLMGVTIDITERKNAENILRESEARFRMVADSAPVLIWMSGRDERYSFFNKRWLEFTGRTLDEEIVKNLAAGVHPDDVEHYLVTWDTAFNTRKPFQIQYRFKRADGEYRWVLNNGVPRYEPNGHFAGYIGSCIDITEQKLAEEALAKSYAEIKELKEQLQKETDYLKAEMKVSQAHGGILGHSQAIKRVLRQVEQVAPADCAVLITGETGTGKELIAQEIHHLSPRKDRIMVLVNCAALPSTLVESELFGRERGAYTGALTSQVGRFELANNSTIFLDEVGELSLEVQAKLLRVLQQGEFQRLGSPKNHKVNVRIITATNRDLGAEVRRGKFREDLYYRLRVFPIELPPLRERAEDIPELVFSFLEEFSNQMGKKVTRIPRKAMDALQGHSWPGNIRELRNVIERSVIVSPASTLKVCFLGETPNREIQPVTLAQAERQHIVKTLESTGWRIKGPYGAATRLAMQPSTLYSRMQKLGIPHRRQKDDLAFAPEADTSASAQ